MISAVFFSRRSATSRIATGVALMAVSLLALTGCVTTTGTAIGDSSVQEVSASAEVVTVTDAWVKAAAEGMTAGFGALDNNSAEDVTVTVATTSVAHMVELHETVQDASGAMVMQQKEGGFVIPAEGRLLLEPGGNHIMMMGLTGPLVAGDEVEFTLTFADGSELVFRAPIKDYSGANETYSNDGGDSDE